MQYKISKLSMSETIKNIERYEYVLLYMMSELKLCKLSQISQIDWEECLEARFFSKDKELHVYLEDGKHEAVEISDLEITDVVLKKYELASKHRNLGSWLCVQEYLAYDEDGQAYVELTRLLGIE